MQRREFISIVGTAAAMAAASPALAQGGGAEPMHPPAFKALEEACSHCVGTGNDCLRHCFGMFAMKDTSMSGCAEDAFQVVAACGALQSLAAVNSPHTGHFAKVVEMVCNDCEKECAKYPNVVECKACGDACKKCAEECRKAAAA